MYVSKGLIAAVFESSEPLHLLRLNGCVSTIPTHYIIVSLPCILSCFYDFLVLLSESQ